MNLPTFSSEVLKTTLVLKGPGGWLSNGRASVYDDFALLLAYLYRRWKTNGMV